MRNNFRHPIAAHAPANKTPAHDRRSHQPRTTIRETRKVNKTMRKLVLTLSILSALAVPLVAISAATTPAHAGPCYFYPPMSGGATNEHLRTFVPSHHHRLLASAGFALGAGYGPHVIGDGYLQGWTISHDGEEICDTPYVWNSSKEIKCD